jgi:hypothetical protein
MRNPLVRTLPLGSRGSPRRRRNEVRPRILTFIADKQDIIRLTEWTDDRKYVHDVSETRQ